MLSLGSSLATKKHQKLQIAEAAPGTPEDLTCWAPPASMPVSAALQQD